MQSADLREGQGKGRDISKTFPGPLQRADEGQGPSFGEGPRKGRDGVQPYV